MADKLCQDCTRNVHSLCLNRMQGVSITCICKETNCQKKVIAPTPEVKK